MKPGCAPYTVFTETATFHKEMSHGIMWHSTHKALIFSLLWQQSTNDERVLICRNNVDSRPRATLLSAHSKNYASIWKIGLDRDYRTRSQLPQRSSGVNTLYILCNVSSHCGTVTMGRTNTRKWWHANKHCWHTYHVWRKSSVTKLAKKMFFTAHAHWQNHS